MLVRRLAVLITAVVAIPMPTFGLTPERCVAGHARDASAGRPHLVDPLEDTAEPSGGLDIDSAWVSMRNVPPWLETKSDTGLLGGGGSFKIGYYPRAFRVNIQVASLQSLRTGVFVAEISTDLGRYFVAAERAPLPEGSPQQPWQYYWGLARADGTLEWVGWSTGVATGDVIAIDLVGYYQLWNDGFTENSVHLSRVIAAVPALTRYGVGPDAPISEPPRMLVNVDEAASSEDCHAVLWAAGEQPSEPSS